MFSFRGISYLYCCANLNLLKCHDRLLFGSLTKQEVNRQRYKLPRVIILLRILSAEIGYYNNYSMPFLINLTLPLLYVFLQLEYCFNMPPSSKQVTCSFLL